MPGADVKAAPHGERGRQAKGGEGGAYICASEPWPLGVLIDSHVPLATYFQ
jgi:hypothetical protein